MGRVVLLEAVPVDSEVGDLGHWHPEPTLNQTMTGAKSCRHHYSHLLRKCSMHRK